MSLTININGLTLCHKDSGGVSTNTLPDVCKTPPNGTPVPYGNQARSKDLTKGTRSVFADGGNMIAIYGSEFATSVFDEAGKLGGVASGTNKAEASWISHSFDVLIEGQGACRLSDKLFMNHGNTVNLAGLCQASLTLEELTEELCRLACECWNKHKRSGPDPLTNGQQYQTCLNKLIEKQTYDGRYPKPDSPLWVEVPFDRGSGWGMIGSKNDPHVPTSNRIRGNSRRLDLAEVKDGCITKLYDVKFPTDPTGGGKLGTQRRIDYEDISKRHTGDAENYREFNVEDECDDCGDEDLRKKRAAREARAAKQGDTVELEEMVIAGEPEEGVDWGTVGTTVGTVAVVGLVLVGCLIGVSEVAGLIAAGGGLILAASS